MKTRYKDIFGHYLLNVHVSRLARWDTYFFKVTWLFSASCDSVFFVFWLADWLADYSAFFAIFLKNLINVD